MALMIKEIKFPGLYLPKEKMNQSNTEISQ